MTDLITELNKFLNAPQNDNPTSRAEFAEMLVKHIYNFVKFDRPEGEGLDGRDGKERQSLAKVVDAAVDHKFRMLEIKHGSK